MYNHLNNGQSKVGYRQLAKHYQEFHSDVEIAISKVTRERIRRKESPPNEAIYDRLIAAAEPKKMEVCLN